MINLQVKQIKELFLLVLCEDQGEEQDDAEKGDGHHDHVGCRVFFSSCNTQKKTILAVY